MQKFVTTASAANSQNENVRGSRTTRQNYRELKYQHQHQKSPHHVLSIPVQSTCQSCLDTIPRVHQIYLNHEELSAEEMVDVDLAGGKTGQRFGFASDDDGDKNGDECQAGEEAPNLEENPPVMSCRKFSEDDSKILEKLKLEGGAKLRIVELRTDSLYSDEKTAYLEPKTKPYGYKTRSTYGRDMPGFKTPAILNGFDWPEGNQFEKSFRNSERIHRPTKRSINGENFRKYHSARFYPEKPPPELLKRIRKPPKRNVFDFTLHRWLFLIVLGAFLLWAAVFFPLLLASRE